jgi:hypothetical protein
MRWRALQNALIVGALGALLSQSTFAQLPGTHLAPGMRSAGAGGVLDCIGGTVTYSGGNTIHTFTTVGSNDFYCPTQRTINYLLVAGGGGSGGTQYSGGGGAGGMLTGSGTINVGTSSVIVGAGGTAGAAGLRGSQGANSFISTPGGAGSWFAVTPTYTPTSFGSGFSGNTLRTRWTTPVYLGTAPATGTQLRVTVGNSTAGNTFSAMWCGHAPAGSAASTANYDGNQVQIKFSGNANLSVPTTPVTSDAVNFAFDKSKDFICAATATSSAVSQQTSAGSNMWSAYEVATNAGSTTTSLALTQSAQFSYNTLIEVFTTQTIVASATGGGGGGSYSSFVQGSTGGSGGGGSYGSTSSVAGTAGQGNAGGFYATGGSGGGGAGAVGANGTSTQAGNGGAGLASTISGASVIYAAGGAGGAYSGQTAGTGGSGIGGNGASYSTGACTNGAPSTGSGGGGISTSGTACNGGSGIVVVSYPSGAPNVNCAGGTITTVGANTVHTFTTVGTANITCATGKAINYLIAAGGGSGGASSNASSNSAGAGGGAGGLLTGTAAFLQAGTSVVTVGAGGPTTPANTSNNGASGGNSSIAGIATATGGGGAASGFGATAGLAGGSGGGGTSGGVGGTGIAGQGFAGGASAGASNYPSGGGGGAAAVGGAGVSTTGGSGGAGTTSSISGTSVCYAGGGAGGVYGTSGTGITSGTATCGGGAAGSVAGPIGSLPGIDAVPNTGGGGGGATCRTDLTNCQTPGVTGGKGGSGIVVVSYATNSTQSPPPGTWKPLITTITLTQAGAGWNGYQWRTRFNTTSYIAGVANSGNTQIRVSVNGGGNATSGFTLMYCGHASAADPSLDFDGNQVQIKFSGNAALTIPAGTAVSDPVNFPFDKTKALICSFGWNSTSYPQNNALTTGLAINSGQASGTAANAGQSAAGFNTSSNNTAIAINQIEVFGP